MTVAAKPLKSETPRDKLKLELARYVPSFEALLPRDYTPERLITGALLAATRNPDVLKCTPQSIAVACAQIAQWNLDVGTTAHLVPFGSTCTAVADYKGYIQQMCKAGARKVEAHVVREGEPFEMERGTEPFIRHTPGDQLAPIIGAYAIAWFRGGLPQFEYMTLQEIDQIRREKSKNWKGGPCPKWYARKTVIRQLAKYVPKHEGLTRLLQEDDLEPMPGEVSPEILAKLKAPPPSNRIVPLAPVDADGNPQPCLSPGTITETVVEDVAGRGVKADHPMLSGPDPYADAKTEARKAARAEPAADQELAFLDQVMEEWTEEDGS